MSNVALGIQRSLAITKKNAKIYYLKPPALIFGLLFPFFIFLAFVTGRSVNAAELVPVMLSMTALFTASSVGPLITPWERQSKTYERMLTVPVSLWHIVYGDIGASFVYGIGITLVPLVLGMTVFGAELAHPLAFVGILTLTVYCFAALGTAIAAYPTDQVSNVMLLANLVRLPMPFISGVFVPLPQAAVWGKAVAMISPLSYAADLIRWSFGRPSYFNVWFAVTALIAFSAVFMCLAFLAHRQAMRRMF